MFDVNKSQFDVSSIVMKEFISGVQFSLRSNYQANLNCFVQFFMNVRLSVINSWYLLEVFLHLITLNNGLNDGVPEHHHLNGSKVWIISAWMVRRFTLTMIEEHISEFQAKYQLNNDQLKLNCSMNLIIVVLDYFLSLQWLAALVSISIQLIALLFSMLAGIQVQFRFIYRLFGKSPFQHMIFRQCFDHIGSDRRNLFMSIVSIER